MFPAVGQLVVHILVFDDGAGDQLGEEGDERAKTDQVLLGMYIAPIDVDGVGHGLEGVERDADGQADAQGMEEIQSGEQGGQIRHDKIVILEKEQHAQVGHQRAEQSPFGHLGPVPVVFNDPAVGVIHQNGKDHNADVHRLAPAIEHQVEQQQRKVAPSAGGDIIDAQ